MNREFKIFLDDIFIGTTNFEFADVPMGVVYGMVKFDNIDDPYLFLKQHYLSKNLQFDFDDNKGFLTSEIQKVIKIFFNENNTQLLGWGAFLSGIKNEFEITFLGLNSDIMKSEFNKHYNDYYL